jgi:hypothetical protein
MDAIKDIIPRVIGPLGDGRATPSQIAQQWQRLSGAHKATSIASLKQGCLTIHVDCSARLVKMNADKDEYLAKLRQNHPEITEIRFKVGKVTPA